MAAMPLRVTSVSMAITPTGGRSKITWSFVYRVKYGPLGWLLGQTMMKMMMSKIIEDNL